LLAGSAVPTGILFDIAVAIVGRFVLQDGILKVEDPDGGGGALAEESRILTPQV